MPPRFRIYAFRGVYGNVVPVLTRRFPQIIRAEFADILPRIGVRYFTLFHFRNVAQVCRAHRKVLSTHPTTSDRTHRVRSQRVPIHQENDA